MEETKKPPLRWLDEEILRGFGKNIKGKQKFESDFPSAIHNGFERTNNDIRISIGSASSPLNEEVTMSHEELRKVWTPEPPLIHDDRIRRSSLWNSAVGLNHDLPKSSEELCNSISEKGSDDSKGKSREETIVRKIEDDIEAIKKQSNLAIEFNSNLHLELQGQLQNEIPQMDTINYLEVESLSRNRIRTKMTNWHATKFNKRKNSMVERLSELLRPRPNFIDHIVQDSTIEMQSDSNAKETLNSNIPFMEKKTPIAEKKKSFAERLPPEWVVLLLGCLLGLSSGAFVVLFNKGVHTIHDFAWHGTPDEGAAWLRTQKLVDIWHRILMIPVVGGIIVGTLHVVIDIIDMVIATQLQSSLQDSGNKINWLVAILMAFKHVIKTTQATMTLGTGSSLGPEGPSVDIGKSWAHGYSNIMKNSKERRIALVAAGAAAGIASGFNAPVAGTFFAIETVLKPQNAENSPPLTTATIILAAVISSTISEILLGEKPPFIVPPYELRSVAELPLYIFLGGICGIMSVTLTHLIAWFTRAFDFLKCELGVPNSVTPSIGAFLTGIIALRYPGVLYWGFTNIDEIMKTGFTTTAPGKGLLAQLTIAKVVATAMCKGSGLVGGLYAPSLFIGAAAGGVYGSIIGEAINKITPGGNVVAHPQAYALVGMAALLASMCSVPMTSVLLLFELTKDYRILLPLMGAVGLAIWVAALSKKSSFGRESMPKKNPLGQRSNALSSRRVWNLLSRYLNILPKGSVWTLLSGNSDVLPNSRVWRRVEGHDFEIELVTLESDDDPNATYISEELLMNECQAADAISVDFVRVNAMTTVKECVGAMLAGGKRCALVVDENDLLEGIMSFADLQSEVLQAVEESLYLDVPIIIETHAILVAAICTTNTENGSDGHNIVVCYPDTSLSKAKELMQSRSLVQLPVVTHVGRQWQDRNNKVVGVLHCEAIQQCIKTQASKRLAILLAQKAKDEDFSQVSEGTH